MARGRMPKDPETRVRRNEIDTSHLEVAHDVPEKLKKLHKRDSFSAYTQMWWDGWVNSEQSQYFSITDWLRLQDIALLKERFYKTRSPAVAAEIRMSESLLGATIGDRMRLKVNALKHKQEQQKPDEPTRSTIELDEDLYEELNKE